MLDIGLVAAHHTVPVGAEELHTGPGPGVVVLHIALEAVVRRTDPVVAERRTGLEEVHHIGPAEEEADPTAAAAEVALRIDLEADHRTG